MTVVVVVVVYDMQASGGWKSVPRGGATKERRDGPLSGVCTELKHSKNVN